MPGFDPPKIETSMDISRLDAHLYNIADATGLTEPKILMSLIYLDNAEQDEYILDLPGCRIEVYPQNPR